MGLSKQIEKEILDTALLNLYGAGLIPCVKYVRTVTNWGLKEAKDYVDAFISEHHFVFPKTNWQLENELNSLKGQLRSKLFILADSL